MLRLIGIGTIALACTTAVALAAGAIAVGECDRAGWGNNYETLEQAHQRALSECRSNGDRSCAIRVTVEHGTCGAFAVSGQCGARGWAHARTEARAVELALQGCRDLGGPNCRATIRFCDGRAAAMPDSPGVAPGRISIVSATLGANCGAKRGNVTDKVAAICNGKETCSLPGTRVNNPDPAFGCPKAFAAEWECSGRPGTRRRGVPAIANEKHVLTMSCK